MTLLKVISQLATHQVAVGGVTAHSVSPPQTRLHAFVLTIIVWDTQIYLADVLAVCQLLRLERNLFIINAW